LEIVVSKGTIISFGLFCVCNNKVEISQGRKAAMIVAHLLAK